MIIKMGKLAATAGLVLFLHACGATPNNETSGINLIEDEKTMMSVENYVDYAASYFVHENSVQSLGLTEEENLYSKPGKEARLTNPQIERLTLGQDNKSLQITILDNKSVTVILLEDGKEIAQTEESYQKFIGRV